MPHRDWKFRVEDILKAVKRIRNYTQDMDYEEFKNDPRTVDAVVRNLITIGEAAARVPEEVRVETAEIPWSDMREMRNFVVHEYFRVSHKILWNTVVHDIRGIEGPLQRLVEQSSQRKNTPLSDILYLCKIGHHKKVSFLWRPLVKDPEDDMVIELAFTSACNFIVTYNKKDFVGAMELGIGVITPKEFLERIGQL